MSGITTNCYACDLMCSYETFYVVQHTLTTDELENTTNYGSVRLTTWKTLGSNVLQDYIIERK